MVIGLIFGVIDYNRAAVAQTGLQNALDSATIRAAQIAATGATDYQTEPKNILSSNFASKANGTLTNSGFTLSTDGLTVSGTATAKIKTTILGLLNQSEITMSAKSDVALASENIEVSLVLDTTASMAGTRIADLKVAAADLVDIVVQTSQSPFYSKVALVPYAVAVNVGSYATQVRGTFTANTTCSTPGCDYYRFTNTYGDQRTFRISNCVSERTGTNAYTDVAPSTTALGRVYPSSANPCLTNTIEPLTSDKTVLKNKIAALTASGSTGGHVGVAWGWYLVSPNFAYLFPTVSKPALYTAEKTKKAVVIMTDGEYNSIYCNGVISWDSITGSGSASDHINCRGPNGSSYSQAQQLCTNMKAAGVIVYTVGLNVINTQAAQDLVNNCATSSAHVYLPSSGTALKEAFRAIARDISQLRISR